MTVENDLRDQMRERWGAIQRAVAETDITSVKAFQSGLLAQDAALTAAEEWLNGLDPPAADTIEESLINAFTVIVALFRLALANVAYKMHIEEGFPAATLLGQATLLFGKVMAAILADPPPPGPEIVLH